jgi:hypothetical protein
MTRRREGTICCRSNLTAEDPATLWRYYIQLTEVEQAFKSSSTTSPYADLPPAR